MTVLYLAVAVSVVSWTVTKEELFRGFRELLEGVEVRTASALVRKLCYMPRCYYCLSHWVSAVAVLLYPPEALPLPLAWLLTVGAAVVLLSTYNLLRAWLRGTQAWADVWEGAARDS